MDKAALRDTVWDELESSGEARFPFPPHGRIPNFADARAAADRLAGTPEWADATAIKANPDAPQLPVRRRALREGKVVYMAVPRLRDERCFYELDPARIDDDNLDSAPTVSHVESYAEQVAPDELPAIDFVVSGSVVVSEQGVRIGKGEGFSDLEYAVLQGLGAVDDETTIATTVHELQVRDDLPEPDSHDVPMDLVVTPERTVRTETPYPRPEGIDWSALSAERLEEMPVLQRLRDKRDAE
ncbi:5-formyltetrahydrofolate cyclo-ligase [Haloferax mediterranei ATCC 33500]|uniref:5-formyltetrahydrofolate cyclo-ligase n=1 Tax=Haloferax mediterranei (strain ATCC 33500 / DSM 1411 / JCM 8866 / NBRC 14739 / NCIMB 2177 / R-4) TaxID=523841 RepID=I3R653_HALMT|nr:5-formyltetrahydrofolate cyclo-ligase [Haloferax mediterranei]AFK19713.1 5-formyltetrahydrofolate cyclo-ligase [Haloferax mediterranei ATCC 33500]AHZ23101.1 5-formyltetrahydrofolate cyclo-ligase [Haloferax mediterranei ATCC 33500]EMA00035.1 5-formyltetrahydrofolate cyclo-ligase [Haloferax mediterranei ATCC 33500]MDX5987542.1 5-formyltetrahydrofolate cyclo-ligase [Haloferax mediterranei ATCC 33500]QCQ74039.1 5-formyltetrahydrofolate cyclo-ligase [Haloferax mediterranei ATCC 33500]